MHRSGESARDTRIETAAAAGRERRVRSVRAAHPARLRPPGRRGGDV